MKNIIVAGVVLILMFFAGWFARPRNTELPVVSGRTDTVWIRDTIRERVFVPRNVEVVRVDTLIVRDTIRVPIPIEQKIYATDNYRAVVEGFRPNLTALEIYRSTPIVTTRPSRWGIGVQAGYGISSGGLSPYIGVGVQYNVLTW